MKVTAIVATLFAGVALAIPTGGGGGTPATPYDPCSGLYDSAQCCATDVLGVADLDCAPREDPFHHRLVALITDKLIQPPLFPSRRPPSAPPVLPLASALAAASSRL